MKKKSANKSVRRMTEEQVIRMEKIHYLLSQHGTKYSSEELINELDRLGIKTTKPTLLKDLEEMRIRDAPIPKIEGGQHGKKYYYEDYAYDFENLHVKHELTEKERDTISALIDLVSSMKGVPELSIQGLVHLKDFVSQHSRKIVSYEENPSPEFLGVVNELFEHIARRKTITFDYHGYHHPPRKGVTLHPRQLRQYDLRFYLIGIDDSIVGSGKNKIKHFAVDRISNIEVISDSIGNWCDDNPFIDDSKIEEIYKDIVGITIPDNPSIEEILFWISDRDYKYVTTKPIHSSQTTVPDEESIILRERYNIPEGGAFIRIKCMINYELKRELIGYGKGLVLLTPEYLNKEIQEHLAEMCSLYAKAIR